MTDDWNDDPDIEAYFAAPTPAREYPLDSEEREYAHRRAVVVIFAAIGFGVLASLFVIFVAVISR